MYSSSPYVGMAQLRVAALAGAWTQVDIPVGAHDALITVDDETASFRASVDNTLAVTEGTFVAAENGITMAGTASQVTTVYVAPANDTTVQVLYQVRS